MPRPRSVVNPYAAPVPKPKIVDLIRLLTPRQKSSYRALSRSLKRLPGVHAELHYFGKTWGWTLRYRRGDAILCTMHFLPSCFDVTITVTRALDDWAAGPNHLSPVTKRDLRALRRYAHAKMLRMPLGSPRRTLDLLRMVRFKVEGRRQAGAPLRESAGRAASA